MTQRTIKNKCVLCHRKIEKEFDTSAVLRYIDHGNYCITCHLALSGAEARAQEDNPEERRKKKTKRILRTKQMKRRIEDRKVSIKLGYLYFIIDIDDETNETGAPSRTRFRRVIT